MKKTTILLFAVTIFLSSCAVFQGGSKSSTFEGKIKYQIDLQDNNLPPEALATMPTTSTVYVKGSKSLTEMISTMLSRKTIKDAETMTATTLLEVLGQKFAIAQSKEELMEQSQEAPKLEFTENTKTILDYEAKEVLVTPKDGETYSVFYTPEIVVENHNFDSPVFSKINGLPLEFSIHSEQLKMKFTVTEIERKKISDEMFIIPEGFQKVTQEELQMMFGG